MNCKTKLLRPNVELDSLLAGRAGCRSLEPLVNTAPVEDMHARQHAHRIPRLKHGEADRTLETICAAVPARITIALVAAQQEPACIRKRHRGVYALNVCHRVDGWHGRSAPFVSLSSVERDRARARARPVPPPPPARGARRHLLRMRQLDQLEEELMAPHRHQQAQALLVLMLLVLLSRHVLLVLRLRLRRRSSSAGGPAALEPAALGIATMAGPSCRCCPMERMTTESAMMRRRPGVQMTLQRMPPAMYSTRCCTTRTSIASYVTRY